MFISVLVIIPRSWKQTECPSKNEWIKKRGSKLFSNKREWGTDTCYITDESCKLMLSERNQSQKTMFSIIPFI